MVATQLAHPLLQRLHHEAREQVQLSQQGGEEGGSVPAPDVVVGGLAAQHEAGVEAGQQPHRAEGRLQRVPPGHAQPHQLSVQGGVLLAPDSLGVQVLVQPYGGGRLQAADVVAALAWGWNSFVVQYGEVIEQARDVLLG